MAKIEWKLGTGEVAIVSVVFAVMFGLPMLLSKQEILSNPSVVFYIILFMFGFFGHVDDVSAEYFQGIEQKKFVLSIGLGLIGFLIIQVTFFIGLTLLATSEGAVALNKWELLIYNAVFVVAAEELVFRDTLPFLLSRVFNRAFSDENLSIAISFVLSSIAFGTLHIWTYGFDLIGVVKAVVSGIILSVIRIYGGLFSSYLAHLIYNSLNILGLFVLPLMILSII
jgi:membrane protease YdiL (CAAX protease family)